MKKYTILLAVLLAACGHKDEPVQSQASVAPQVQPVAQAEPVAFKESDSSVIGSVNDLFDGGNSPSQAYVDQYKSSYEKNFASAPNVDPLQVAKLLIPDLYKENNSYKQQDIIKANQGLLSGAGYGKTGLVAISVPAAIDMKLTNASTGEYTINFMFPGGENQNGLNFNANGKGHVYRYTFNFAQTKKQNIVKVLGEAQARKIEDLVGGKRDANGWYLFPATFYVTLKKATLEQDNAQLVGANVEVDIDHADVDFGDLNGIQKLVSLSKSDVQEAQVVAKGGTVPKGWY